MDKKLDIKLFRFNHKTDYLPYYKSFTVTCKKSDTVLSLLSKLNNMEPFSFDGVENFGVKVNNLFLNVETTIQELLEKFETTELTIDPVSVYRAINDLTINNKDFYEKLELFRKYLNKDQIAQYAVSLQLDYYASNTLNFNKEYIGDHALLITSDIIEQDPELEEELLTLISDKENGIWFQTSVDYRMFDTDEEKKSKINALVEKVTGTTLEKNTYTVPQSVKVAQDFVGFNIAAYDMEDTCSIQNIVEQSKASFIKTQSQNDDLALHSLGANKSFTYKIAGKVLLDAIDNNADFILVNNQKNFSLLDSKQKEIECAIGRDINLPIVTTEQFSSILSGEKDPTKLGFNKHKVAISFL